MKINTNYQTYTPKIAFKQEKTFSSDENFEFYKNSLADSLVTKRIFITSKAYNSFRIRDKFSISFEDSYNFASNTLKEKIKESKDDIEIAKAYKEFFLANKKTASTLYSYSAKYTSQLPETLGKFLQREEDFNQIMYNTLSSEEVLLNKAVSRREILLILISSTVFVLSKLEASTCNHALKVEKIFEMFENRLSLIFDRFSDLKLDKKSLKEAGEAFDAVYNHYL